MGRGRGQPAPQPPRYLRAVSARDTAVTLFGRTYAALIGLEPVGLGNLIWPRVDRLLAPAVHDANVPCILSTAGLTSIEDIAALAPDHV
nr:alpha-hydroxy-acid oxidizing protein [Azospirillum sp. TSO35-2]